MNNKPKLITKMQIKHMKSKGITFDIINEEDAAFILTHKNYYFKLTAYRKNFKKTNNKYKQLDFAYLVDLASIDMQLREYLLSLCLDIEHSIKVKLIDLITKDPTEDGYEIVIDFKKNHPNSYKKTFEYLKHNPYMKDLYEKHHTNPPIWAFLEVMTLGSLSIFIDFYCKRTNNKSARNIKSYFKYTKNIRNSCAHSNPLLVNLFSKFEQVRKPSQNVKFASNIMNIDSKYIKDEKINDIVSLVYLHKKFQSKELGKHRYEQGSYLISRMHRHINWYLNIKPVITFINIFDKCIDYLE